MSNQRWIAGCAVIISVACLGAALGRAAAQEKSATTMPFAGAVVEVEAARAAGRQMQAQAAVLAGYPVVGTTVEIWTSAGYKAGVPSAFDPGNVSGSNNFLYVGKVAAFDAHWVGLEAEDGSRVWIPREGVSQVRDRPTRTPKRVPQTQAAH
jgi:hypothetical protein